jgi:hypothetical protein
MYPPIAAEVAPKSHSSSFLLASFFAFFPLLPTDKLACTSSPLPYHQYLP